MSSRKKRPRPSKSPASSKVLVNAPEPTPAKVKPFPSNPTNLEFSLRPFRERFFHSYSYKYAKWSAFSLPLLLAAGCGNWIANGEILWANVFSTFLIASFFPALFLLCAIAEARHGLERVLWGETDVTFILQRYTKQEIVSIPIKDFRRDLNYEKGDGFAMRFCRKGKILFSLQFPAHPHKEEISAAFENAPNRSLSEYLAYRFFGK